MEFYIGFDQFRYGVGVCGWNFGQVLLSGDFIGKFNIFLYICWK